MGLASALQADRGSQLRRPRQARKGLPSLPMARAAPWPPRAGGPREEGCGQAAPRLVLSPSIFQIDCNERQTFIIKAFSAQNIIAIFFL